MNSKELSVSLIVGAIMSYTFAFAETLRFEPNTYFVNDDGSLMVHHPKVETPDGKLRWISNKSITNGLCQLYGLGSSRWFTIYDDFITPSKTVILGKIGEFVSYYNKIEDNYRFENIYCVYNTNPAPSYNYEKMITNPDGSKTIVNPRFNYVAGRTGNFSIYQNHGVCKLFGLNKLIDSRYVPDTSWLPRGLVTLDSEGKIIEAYLSKNSEPYLKSITCK
jgi:hypothetical protein